jgi:S1-C subfamily serine protease
VQPAAATDVAATPGPVEIGVPVAASVVRVQPVRSDTTPSSAAQRQGSGTALGVGIITTDHVVGDADQREVMTSDGQQRMAQVAWRSPARDLVLLQTDLSLPAVDLEPARQQNPQEAVAVVGYRLTSAGHANLTTNYPQISSVQQDQEGITYLQTNALMDPGMSGGPCRQYAWPGGGGLEYHRPELRRYVRRG